MNESVVEICGVRVLWDGYTFHNGVYLGRYCGGSAADN
jgi:hypothetical protein